MCSLWLKSVLPLARRFLVLLTLRTPLLQLSSHTCCRPSTSLLCFLTLIAHLSCSSVLRTVPVLAAMLVRATVELLLGLQSATLATAQNVRVLGCVFAATSTRPDTQKLSAIVTRALMRVPLGVAAQGVTI